MLKRIIAPPILTHQSPFCHVYAPSSTLRTHLRAVLWSHLELGRGVLHSNQSAFMEVPPSHTDKLSPANKEVKGVRRVVSKGCGEGLAGELEQLFSLLPYHPQYHLFLVPQPESKRTSALRIAVVRASWNGEFVQQLWDGVRATFLECGVQETNIKEEVVPGAYELPITAQYMATHTNVDAILVIAVLVQREAGDTTHFESAAQAVSQGIMQVGRLQLFVTWCVQSRSLENRVLVECC